MKLFSNHFREYPPEHLTWYQQTAIFVWEIFKVVVISLAIIIPVRYYLIKPFYVKGASMEPNFYNHEYLIIDEISYRFNEPKRGETVVFKYPFDTAQYFIKRVIGLPGEKIKITNGKVFVCNAENPNCKNLTEDYLLPGMKTLGEFEVVLKNNEYYLLGDNRIASLDSRSFGPVDRKLIVGKTAVRGWPISRLGLLNQEINYGL